MNYESRVTWEKLALELELLVTEDPSSLVPLLIGANSVLWPGEGMEWCSRNINFMSYELIAKCENYEESDRFHILTDYFFDQKGFQLIPLNKAHLKEEDYLIKPVLSQRTGSALTISLIYLHLASHLDVPAYMIRLQEHYILKWIRSGKSNYIDLANGGRLFSEEQVLKLLQATSNKKSTDQISTSLDILPNRKIFSNYITDLIQIYEQDSKVQQLLTSYDILLKIDPSNAKYLARRALLRQRLGYAKEALSDLKRYFSFVDKEQASPEVQMAFVELQQLQSLHTPDLLH